MQGSDSQIKTMLETPLKGTILTLVSFWNCFIVSLPVVVSPIWEVEKNPNEKSTFA